MSKEIAVVGSPQFVVGFRLAGVQRVMEVPKSEKDDALDTAVEGILTDSSVGILVMHDDDVAYLSRELRDAVATTVEPTVVTVGGGQSDGLREQIRQALGIDLLQDGDERS